MALQLDPKTTALVMIDLQKGIVSRPLTPHAAEQVVENSVAMGRALKQKGGTVVAVHVAFSADGRDRLRQPVDAPMQVPPGGIPAEFWEFDPRVLAMEPPLVITKRQWGAFHGTELDLQLRRRSISTIVLSGIATNIGVESTAREAWQHGYSVVIAEDACSSMHPTLGPAFHQFAVEQIFPRIARVRSTAEVLAAI